MTRCMVAWMVATLALAPTRVVAATDDEPENSSAPASLRVDVSGLGNAYEHIKTDVETRASAIVDDLGPEATADVTIDWINPDDFHYAIEVRIDLGGGTKVASRQDECNGCTATDLVDRVVSTAEAAIADAQRQAEAAVEAPEEPADPIEAQPAAAAPMTDAPPRRARLGAMGWAGVGLLVAGVGTGGTGGAFLGLGQRKPKDEPIKLRDFRTPGIALVATGGALLVTGVVLVVLDRKRAERRLSVLPGIGGGVATLGVVGRF